MAGGGHGRQAQAFGQAQVAQGEGADGRLRHAGIGERCGLLLLGLHVESGVRQDGAGQLLREIAMQGAVGQLQGGAQLFDVDRGFAAHVDVLRALAGEEEGDLGRFALEVAAEAGAGGNRLAVAAETGQYRFDIGQQAGEILGDDGQRYRVAHSAAAAALGLARQAVGEVTQLEVGALAQGRGHAAEVGAQRRFVLGLEQEQFQRPARRAGRGGGGEVAAVLFQHGMEIGAAEAEGGDAAAARVVRVGQPRTRVLEQVHRRVGVGDGVDRLAHAVVRGQGAVVQRQRHLDQAGDTGAGLGVAEQGLDRADGAALRQGTFGLQGFGDGLGFGAVADRGAGAVGFGQAQGGGREAGAGVGAAQGALLAFGARCGHAQRLAVGGAGDGLDHGVDLVAVALGVGQALHGDDRQAFADGDAVGGNIEGLGLAGGRQGLGLGEAQETERTLHRVHAAGDGEVAAAGFQLVHRHADGGEGGGAGRVHGEVEAAEIHAVGDTPGGDIQQRAGEGLLGPFGQAFPHALVRVLDEARDFRAHGVLRAQIAQAATGAEDDGGVLAVEVAVGVTGVREGALGHFQGEELHRVDHLHRLRRDAVGDRVERHLVEEAAPARVDLVAGAAVGVEVELPVPARLGHFAQHADLFQDVVPVLVGVVGLGQQGAEADDGDVAGLGRFDADLAPFQMLIQDRRAADGDVAVQLVDGLGLVAQGGDLADHVHAVAELLRGFDGDDGAAAVAVHALGGDAQPAHVEVFEDVADLVGGAAFAQQGAAGLVEVAGESGVGAAGGMAGAGFQVDGAGAFQRLGLEAFDDGAGVHDFLGEQVGRAHQAADLHAARRQRRGERREHGARAGVVQAAGEQQVILALGAGLDVGQQRLGHLFPQREAGERADVAAALAAFEDETLGALLDVHLEQRRRRGVDVGGDAALLELRRLVRTAAGDEGVGRLALPDGAALLLAQRVRHEAEHAHAPGQVAHLGFGLLQHLQHLRAAHQGQGQEGQAALQGDLISEFGAVRDAGHRTLGQRVAGAVRLRQRAAGGHEALLRGALDLAQAGLAQGLHEAADGFVLRAVDGGDADALAQRQEVVRAAAPGQAGVEAAAPLGQVQRAGFGGTVVLVGSLQRGGARARVDAAGGVDQFAEELGLGAVEAGEFVLLRFRQGRFGQQQELVVHHHAGHAEDAAGGGTVDADAAVDVDRLRNLAGQFLQQDVAGIHADPAAGLVALGDDAMVRIGEGGGNGGIGDLGQDLVGSGGLQGGVHLRLCIGAAGKDQGEGAARCKQGQHPPGQLRATGCQTQPDAGLSGIQQTPEVGQGPAAVAAELQVQQADAAGTRYRHGDAGVGRIGRCQAEDIEVFHGAHPASPLQLIPLLLTICRGRSLQPAVERVLALLAFQEGYFQHFFVHDRSVAEITTFAEALSVVGGDDEMGVLRRLVYQGAEHFVDVFHALHLLVVQGAHLLVVEELVLGGLAQLIIQAFEHAVYTRDVGQALGVQHVGVMRLAQVEEVELGLGLVELDLLHHAGEVVVVRHQLVVVEVAVQVRQRVEHRQRHLGAGAVAVFLQHVGQGQLRHEALEREVGDVEAIHPEGEVLLVDLGGEHALRTLVGDHAHQIGVVRRAGPGGEGIALLAQADAVHVGTLGAEVAVVTAAVHDDEDQVVLAHARATQ